jgi:tRNA(Ile)-lysidine synthase
VDDFIVHVASSIRDHKLIRPGQPVLVAVSGGLDSMALLHALLATQNEHRSPIVIAHLNHQLRGRSSDADERLVRRTGAKLGIDTVVERLNVAEFARKEKISLEMAARKLRHEFLARTAVRLKIPTIALAHHADDQIELFFLRLFRGSGGEGLAGMGWVTPHPSEPAISLVRPFLDLAKTAIRDFALKNHIRFREDASNAAIDIPRNRIRHELLPLLRAKYQPGIDSTIPRVMELLGAEADFARQAAQAWLASKLRKPGASPGTPQLPFRELRPAVQRRCIELQLLDLGIVPDFNLIEQMRLQPGRPICVSAEKRGAADQISGQRKEADPPIPLARVNLDPAGLVHAIAASLPGFGTTSSEVGLGTGEGTTQFDGVAIQWQVKEQVGMTIPKPKPGFECFDADRVGSRIVLRHWCKGDRFQPIGMTFAVKLQDFFTNEKVPRARRHELIVAETADGEVFWVEGLRISERFRLTESTKRRLLWRWFRR